MSLGSRVAGTAIVGVCWLVFILSSLAFFASTFHFWQNIAIFLIATVIGGGAVAVMWIKWTLK
jgi:hypothetical protein